MMKSRKNEFKINEYSTVIYFEEGIEKENVRALAIINDLRSFAEVIAYYPEDIAQNSFSAEIIKKEGFKIRFKSRCTMEELRLLFTKNTCFEEISNGRRVFHGRAD